MLLVLFLLLFVAMLPSRLYKHSNRRGCSHKRRSRVALSSSRRRGK